MMFTKEKEINHLKNLVLKYEKEQERIKDKMDKLYEFGLFNSLESLQEDLRYYEQLEINIRGMLKEKYDIEI